MKTRSKRVILFSILLMAGCSANRQTRHPDDAYISQEPVPGGIRHADEYESGDQQYEYEYEYEYDAAPSPGKMNDSAHSPSPTTLEPVPAPPAIGISRVKSVSWLGCLDNKSTRSSCGDSSDQCDCATGSVSPLTPDYFLEGCTTPPRTAAIPPKQCREKTTLVEVVRGWNLRFKTRGIDRVFPPRTCGEQIARRLGSHAPNGCATNHTDDQQHTTRNVKKLVGGKSSTLKSETHKDADNDTTAYPLHAGNRDVPETISDPGFSSDELMEFLAHLEQTRDEQQARVPAVPDSPAIDDTHALPLTAAPILPPPTSPPAVQQVDPDSVRNSTRPPMWPRLGQPSAKSANLPVAKPWSSNDSSLPVIQPGRRI